MGARKLHCWLLGLAMCAGLAVVPEAGAATYILRPNADIGTSQWKTDPDGRADWQVLDDAVVAPTTPSTSGDRLYENGNGPQVSTVGYTTVALAPGEVVTRVRLWAYVQTGGSQSLRGDILVGGSTVASTTMPSDVNNTWGYIETTSAISQAALDGLSSRATLLGSGAASNTYVYASYLEVTTAAPPVAPTITARPGADGSSPSPSWSFTAPGGLATDCRISSATVVVSNWSPCVSPRSYNLALQADDTYTFAVRTRDGGGLTSSATTDAYRLDRAAPAAPVVAGPPSPSGDPAPSWSFTGEPGAGFECRITRPGATILALGACTSATGADLSAQPSATYTFEVRAIDAAGNAGPFASSAYVLDTTVPGPPSPAVSPPRGSTRSPIFTFAAGGAASHECTLTQGATVLLDQVACASPYSPTIPPMAPDGDYVLSVRGISAGGNLGPAGTVTYALDTQAPLAVGFDGGPPATSDDATPTWSWIGEPGATFSCEVREGARVVVTTPGCTSPATFDLEAEPDGTYTLVVGVTDAAGNAGPDAARSSTLDRNVPPAPSIDGGPPPSGASRAPAWSFSGAAAVSFECRLTGPSGFLDDWTACAGSQGYDLTGAAEGVYTFAVRGVGGGGTPGSAATADYRLDVTVPAAPTLVSPPSSPAAGDRPAWAFTAETGASTECRLERGGAPVANWSSCSSPETFDLSASADGTYVFLVRATDAAGNVGPAASATYVLDREAPAAPVIDAPPPATGPDRTPTVGFTGTAPAFECRVTDSSGTDVVGPTTCGPGPWTPLMPLGADDTYTFGVRGVSATGVPGPEDTATYALDTAAPAAPVIATGPASPTADDTAELAFTGEPGATFACQARHATHTSAWAACTSPAGFDLSARDDGAWTLAVRATDAAGNAGTESTHAFTLDRARPVAPTITAAPGASGTSRAPAWSFTGTGASFACRIDAAAAFAPCTSPAAYDLTGRPDGTYTFEVRAVSVTGVDGDIQTSTYALDTTGPGAPSITARTGAAGRATQPSWSFTAPAGAGATSCRVERGDGTAIADWAACASPYTAELGAAGDGTYRFLVRAADALGTQGSTASDTYRLDRAVPPAPSLTPAQGALGASRTPAWSFSGEAGTTFECRVDGPAGVLADWAACASPRAADLGAGADGAYALVVRAVDAAGNRGAEARDAYTLDTTPGAVQLTSAPPPLGRERALSWAFTGGEPGGTFECRVELGGVELAAWAACAPPFAFDLAGRPDGPVRFAVRPVDAVGNAGAEAQAAYVLDTTAPAPPVFGAGPDEGAGRRPRFAFTGEAGALFTCQVERGGRALTEWAACTSPFGADLAGVEPGPHRIAVRAADVAGNLGEPAARSYELLADKAAPADAPVPTATRDPRERASAPGPAGDTAAERSAARGEGDARAGAGQERAGAAIVRGGRSSRPRRLSPGAARRPAERARRAAPPAPVRRAAEERSPLGDVGAAAQVAARAVAAAVTEHPDKTVFPASLILLVVGFLGVQNRFDRSDPKLALAPVAADPDMDFPLP